MSILPSPTGLSFDAFRERVESHFAARQSKPFELLPRRGTPEYGRFVAETFYRWAVQANHADLVAETDFARLLAVAKHELAPDELASVVVAFDEAVKASTSQPQLDDAAVVADASRVAERLQALELNLRMFFHCPEGDRDLWTAVLKHNYADSVALIAEADVGWCHHPAVHALFNMFLLVRLAIAGRDDGVIREKVVSSLVELADHSTVSKGPSRVARDLAQEVRTRGVGGWIQDSALRLGRMIAFDDDAKWIQRILERCDASWQPMPQESVMALHRDPPRPVDKRGPTPPPPSTTDALPPRAPALPVPTLHGGTAAAAASSSVANVASRHVANSSALPPQGVKMSTFDVDDDADVSIGAIVERMHKEKAVIVVSSGSTTADSEAAGVEGHHPPSSGLGIKRPRLEIVTPLSAKPVASALPGQHFKASSTSLAAASAGANGGVPCRSRYHTKYAATTSHASRECCFCATCHVMEFLFNGSRKNCTWNHLPTTRKIAFHLKAFADIYSLACQRLEVFNRTGFIAPIEIPT